MQFRSAAKGAALRPWASLRRGTTNTLVRRPAEDGSAWCFRFRARDGAGNLSTWSPARCSALAVQDDAFYAPADALRIHSKLALDDCYLHLDYPGASLTLKQPQIGSHLALWVISGPGQGSGDVYVGATRVGRLSLSSTTWRRKLVVFPMPGTGVVRVVQRGPRPVGVDALAVER